MIHADDEMIEAWAKECRRKHPGIRLENWRIYVRAVVAAINEGGASAHEPLRAAFNDGAAAEIVNETMKRLGTHE